MATLAGYSEGGSEYATPAETGGEGKMGRQMGFYGPRVLWAADGGGGGGEPSNVTQPTGEQAPKTFTQEQVDAIIKDRLARQADRFKDYEDLKKAAGRLKEIEDANLSEIEKAKKASADAEARAQAAEARAREITTRLEVERQARRLNIVDEDAAYRLLEAGAITYGDGGQPTNVEELLKELVKARPYLVVQASSGGSPMNPARNHGNEADDAFTAALYRGAGLPREKG